MKETPAWTVFRDTISELRPGPTEQKAWCTCHVGQMIQNWASYADDHRHLCKSGILEDGVLGPAWKAVGRGLREFLNGRILVNAGVADACIVNVFRHEGLEL